MKITIIGCGAIGGLLGTKLMSTSAEITMIDRGTNVNVLNSRGLCVIGPNGSEKFQATPSVMSGNDNLEAQDIVFLAVKAHQIGSVLHQLSNLMHDDTVIVTLQNGIPWWYFQCHGGPHDGMVIQSVDPNGIISSEIDPKRILGCIVYAAAEVIKPGLIKHVEGYGFPIGELDNSKSKRAELVSQILIQAGFHSPILTDIRGEIWLKSWGTMAFNPISALTGSTLVEICRHQQTRTQIIYMMKEAEAIATRLGITFRVPLERRIAGAERVGAHRTSTLQDIEHGRKTEIDALLGAVIELSRLTETPTPRLEAIYACTKLLEKTILEYKSCSISQK